MKKISLLLGLSVLLVACSDSEEKSNENELNDSLIEVEEVNDSSIPLEESQIKELTVSTEEMKEITSDLVTIEQKESSIIKTINLEDDSLLNLTRYPYEKSDTINNDNYDYLVTIQDNKYYIEINKNDFSIKISNEKGIYNMNSNEGLDLFNLLESL